jgi:asparagine synthase (glutamine-hydrolysing)
VNSIQGYALARLARPHVKAVLSGLGGDELFAGYTMHRFVYPTDRWHRATPAWLRPSLQAASRAVGRGGLPWLDQYRRGVQLLLAAGDPGRAYLLLRNAWDHDPAAFGLYGPAWADRAVAPVASAFAPHFAAPGHALDQVLRAELRTKLVDDLLLNEDRMSMAHGLEVRVPFLDRALVRFALGIPPDVKMRGNRAKALFRRALGPLLPAHTLRKRKQGFAFDAPHQFRRDLRTTVERVLTRERVEARGWFDYGFLRRILDHRPHSGLRRQYFLLWLVLGLEIWARMFLDRGGADPELTLDAYW